MSFSLNSRLVLRAVFISVFGLLVTINTSAQTVLEEVIVTATKHGEVSVQDVPIGIQAIGGDAIDDFNFRSVEEFARLAPSMTFATQGRGDSQLIIRGISSPGSSTVGVYFDEAVITGANFQDGGGRTPDIGAYDVQRVEILKGPQGTLFGASAMSGAVRIITNKPDASGFDANAQVGGLTIDHGGEGFSTNGMINIPIIDDVLAIRGVGWYQDEDGFIDTFFGYAPVVQDPVITAGTPTAPGFAADLNDLEKVGGRIALRWNVNESMTFDAFGLYQKTEIGGPDAFYPISSGTLESIPISFLPFLSEPALQGGFGDLTVQRASPFEPFDDEIGLYGATFTWDTGFGELLATANYFDRQIFTGTDTTGTCHFFGLGPAANNFLSGGFAPPGTGADPCWIGLPQDRSVMSTEVRFSSDLDGPVNFVAGFFYEEDFTYSSVDVTHANRVTGIPSCTSRADCLRNLDTSLLFSREHEIDLDFFRIFGHVDWEITDKLTIGGGLAYYESDQRIREFRTQDFQDPDPFQGFTFPPAFGGPFQTEAVLQQDRTTSEDEVTFDAVVSYQITEDQLLYYRAASGFRPGSLNPPGLGVGFGAVIPDSFQPDSVTSHEIGAKTSWYDQRVTLNATYFYMNWKDIHVPGADPSGTVEFIANAGQADVHGLEVEMIAQPSDPWFISLGFTYIDASLGRDQTLEEVTGTPGITAADIIAGGGDVPPIGFGGDRIPKVPEVALSGTVEYNTPFAWIDGVHTYIRSTFSYTDSSTTFFNDDFTFNAPIGDYFLLDLSASFVYKNMELRVFGTNLTDERAVTDVDFQQDGFDTFTVRPRTFGVQANWRWDG